MRIAVLPGDGVGPEVVREARRCIEALTLGVEWTELDWGSERWRRSGRMMPEDALDIVREHDAVLLGAVGDPLVPDHVTLWGLTLPLRQRLDLWANLRPVRLFAGIPSPLRACEPGDLDMMFVRENTEGEYAGVGGLTHKGLQTEVAVEASVFSRVAVERLLRYAFGLARQRRGILTSATKSNASRYGYVLWDRIAADVALEFEDVRYERVLVDALAARMVLAPKTLDVVVGSNLFADILSDLAGAIQGGLGTAASANIAPGTDVPGIFEPVHGSAPDIAGRGIANPTGAVWSAALMLEHLGEATGAERIMRALEKVCMTGPRTPDVGGRATTTEVGDAIVDEITRD